MEYENTISEQCCIQKGDDGQHSCEGNLRYTSNILNDPFFILIELDKYENKPVQPKLSTKIELNFSNQIYDLTAIIYHHSVHFCCEKLVTSKGYKHGWYLYKNMSNNGQGTYVRQHPQVATPSYMHIFLFENVFTTPTRKENSKFIYKALHQKSKNSFIHIILNNTSIKLLSVNSQLNFHQIAYFYKI